jgi:hypothetical protein
MPAFLRCRGNNREGLSPPSPVVAYPTHERPGTIIIVRVVIFFT